MTGLGAGMSAKITARRRAKFLHFLAASGNLSLSAERAKVSRSWVGLHRSTDPAFDAACRGAIAEARVTLGHRQARGAASGWGFADGAELVINASNGRRVQVRRAKYRQWTPRIELRFLDALVTTCNAKAAARAAGMSMSSAYAHRRRWPRFAALWDEAVDVGAAVLEGALIAGAIAYIEGEPSEIDGAIRVNSIGEALKILQLPPRRGAVRREWQA